jgi:hypothetical protein
MDSFAKNRIGPVVTSDELQYRAELRLLDRAAVRLELAGLSPGGGRFRLRNTFVRADGRTAAKPSPRRSAGSTSARAASPRRRRASGSSSPTCHTPTTSPSSRRSRPAEGRLLDPPAPA